LITIIVPTFNEEGNINALVTRIAAAFENSLNPYTIFFVDDRSTDGTIREIRRLAPHYSIKFTVKPKTIPRGKAYSLLLAFDLFTSEYIGMIDADLQYPPEALPAMMERLDEGADIVVGERVDKQTSFMRKSASDTFNYIFVNKLHDLKIDSQSGLKVFKKEVIESITVKPTAWTFDLEFLLRAKHTGFVIESYPIVFAPRTAGKTKISLFKASYEIGKNALQLKSSLSAITPFRKSEVEKYGVGFHHKGKRFVPHTSLHYSESAVFSVTAVQKVIGLLLLATIIIGLFFALKTSMIVIIAILTFLYFADLLFNFYLIYHGLAKEPEIRISKDVIAALPHREWPMYTIFCPLYKEWEVLPQFIYAMSRIDYPKDRLQVMLLLEENDPETVQKAREFNLPSYFDIVVVPDSKPKTKPKACNYGLLKAQGEYIVIYDAEDAPNPLQLKQAVLAFESVPDTVKCIQAKLNYYNPRQNLLTRFFTAEYSLWFDLILPGLQSFNTLIPLGGTSNHFRKRDLVEMNGWDAFNVTEDCDLGIRLAKRGFTTAIMDSITLEEANSDFKNWIWQRSRWIKGYMQSYLVHMRNPYHFIQNNKKMHLIALQINVGAKILSLFINPFMWIVTIVYFAARATVGPTIEELFPPVILYMAVTSLLVGNFMYLYAYMLGCAKRKHYGIIKFSFLIPFYWLMMSISAWVALYQMIVAPHSWAKTKHGLHLKQIQPVPHQAAI
jgi:cellulose synthase/poly-beta-1,6-N-acetylglucosamine synthase-like glycosyltransferase